MNENETNVSGDVISSLTKLCPCCGAALLQGIKDGFLCWYCPEEEGCGYIGEPV